MQKYGHVYIVEFQDGCKIGQTTVPLKVRLNPFRQPWCQKINNVYVSKVPVDDLSFFEARIIDLLERHYKVLQHRNSEFFPHRSEAIRKVTKKILKWAKYE